MTNSFTVYGSAKVQEIALNKFDYSADVTTALAQFATKVATCKKEIATAFNALCHIAMAQSCSCKTAKERHSALQASRDAFFEALPKKYASAYAKGITALEWGIPDGFEEFDFSDFLESTPKESAPKERGAQAIFKGLYKKYDALANKKNRTAVDNEELKAYAFLIQASKEFKLQ